MKLLFTFIMFSSMLFSMQTQKQIILGSYLVQTNAENALITLNKQIENDEKLKEIIKKNSLKVSNAVISGYTVVSVNAFDSYVQLLRSIKMLQKYNSDAYVLSYPIANTLEKETLVEVEAKASKEQILEQEMLKEQRLEQEMLEEQRLEQEMLEEQRLEQEMLEEQRLEQEMLKKQILEQDKALEEKTSSKIEGSLYSGIQKDKESNDIDFSDYYLIIALSLLVLIIGGFVLYNQFSKKNQDIELNE